MRSQGLWDDDDGFYYDVFTRRRRRADPDQGPFHRGRPAAADHGGPRARTSGPAGDVQQALRSRSASASTPGDGRRPGQVLPGATGDQLVLGVIPTGDGFRVLHRVFDEDEFLSPYGLRALSRHHASIPCPWTWAGTRSRSTTSPLSRRPGCSVATPTGADRSGCRSTTSSCAACSATPSPWAQDFTDRVPHGQRQIARPRRLRRGPAPPPDRRCSCADPTGGAPATARSTRCRTIPAGGTTSPSSSTSTATTAPGSAPPTRPDGPGSSPT